MARVQDDHLNGQSPAFGPLPITCPEISAVPFSRVIMSSPAVSRIPPNPHVYRLCSYLPAIGILAYFLPNLEHRV